MHKEARAFTLCPEKRTEKEKRKEPRNNREKKWKKKIQGIK